jgi:hypothetical protein
MALLKHLKVVVASPNDVQEERDSLQEILEDINQQIAIFFGLYLDLVRYEDDAFPGFHKYGPQGLIDEILQIKDCDVFIGIFWKKFGTPTNMEQLEQNMNLNKHTKHGKIVKNHKL